MYFYGIFKNHKMFAYVLQKHPTIMKHLTPMGSLNGSHNRVLASMKKCRGRLLTSA